MTFDPVTTTRIIFSVIIVAGILILTAGLRQYINLRVEEPTARSALKRAVTVFAVIAIVVAMGVLWLQRLGNLSVALGLVTAAVAVAMQEVVSAFAGWLLITSGRAFQIGDRIEMGGIQGDVIGFGVLRTTMMEIGNWVKGDQPTGRTVTVSNSAVFQKPIYNYTRYFHFLWDEIGIPITFTSNIPKAVEIITEAATGHTASLIAGARGELEEMARQFQVSNAELRPTVYVTFNDNWVELSLRYLTEARTRRRTRHEISSLILTAISAEPDIRFSSSTVTVTVQQESSPDGGSNS